MINTTCPHCWEKYSLSDDLIWKKAKCKVCKNEFIIKEVWEEKIEERKTVEKSPDLRLKPNKISFILFSNPLIIILPIIAIFLTFISIYISIVLFWLTLFLVYWELVKYRKEEYILTDRKIIYHSWNLISDNVAEINLDKITEVKASIPFLQKILFKTWNIFIQTAWAWTSVVKLSNINNTMEVYEEFRKRMQKNWFHLKKDKLVQAEKPHIIWIIWEIFSKSFWIIIFAFYFLFSVFEGLSEIDNPLWDSSFWIWMTIFFFIFWLIFIWYIIITYLDLRKRRYEIFTDSIWYHEWFLNEHYAFIPMEVVADVENTQSFFSKIFGLHDIVISSAWSSNKVVFKNMVNWETMIKNIRYLKDHIVMNKKDVIEGEEKTVNSLIWFKDKIEEPLDFDKEFEAHFKMDIRKTIIETLPTLIFPPLFLIILIWRLIQLFFTDYNIRKTTIEKKFELFSTKFTSFSIEKITWVQIKQSIVDRFLWTCTIKFWSIGSSFPLVFDNIKKPKGLEEKILAKVWIKKEEKNWDIKIDFSLSNFLKANFLKILPIILIFILVFLFWLVSFLIIDNPLLAKRLLDNIKNVFIYMLSWLIIFILIPWIWIFIYQKFFFSPKRYLREIYKNYIKTQNWIFFITKKYVLFRHIKWVKTTKYPITNTWKLYLNVAWETIVANEKELEKHWSSWVFKLSNSVEIQYVQNVFEVHDYFDSILNWKEINKEKIIETKQDLINTILPMIILILPIIFVPITIWIIKVKSWTLEKSRVLYKSWIIYKKRHSILYNRFNFIDLKRWFLNKIFKNGSVNIYTLWSSWVDMVIRDTKDYNKIYELLKID